jgi:hypothetical protein
MIQYNVIFNTTGDPDNQFVGTIKQYSVDQYRLKVYLPDSFDTGFTISANIKRADDDIGSYVLAFSTDHWVLDFVAFTTLISGELQVTIQAVDGSANVFVFKTVTLNVEETVAPSDFDPAVDSPEYTTIIASLATKQPLDGDLTSIAGLSATSGVLKKTAANTWALSNQYFELVDGLIPAEYLPTYVDDVIEGILVNSTTFTVGGTTITPESGKIYVSLSNEKVYRWSGTLFVEISSQITVGNLTGQAFDGLLGKQAFDNAALAVSWGNHANASYLTASSTAITNISNNVANLQGDLGNLTNTVSDTNNLVSTINGSYLTASSTTITNIVNTANQTTTDLSNLTNVVANKVDSSLVGANNGIATLDEAGKVPSSQLPSFVDDVLEYANLAGFPVSGETGKIYVAIDTGLTYRWSGTIYVEISQSLALGNTSATAFRGDLGAEAYNWGNHALAGYLTAEADTLDSVATRGNTTNSATINFATTNEVAFNTTSNRGTDLGKLGWNTSDQTLQVGLGNGVVLQLGQETLYVVRNATGSTILNGTPVSCTGVTPSGRLEISPSTGTIDPVTFLGIATQDITNGVNGKVTYFGYVNGLDTRGTAASSLAVGDETWAEGDKLYVHPTVAGKLTNVEPEAPKVKICVASVIIRHQSVGVLFVRPTSNLDLTKLSDVQISSVANGEVLAYNGTANRWENKEVVSLGLNVALTNIANDQYLAYNNGTWVNRDLNAVTTTQITNWDNTYNIVDANAGNWNSAFSYGNHQAVGYIVGLANATVTDGNIASWNGTTGKLLKDTGVAISSILTSESDPVFTASNAFGITGTDKTNWNAAFAWGNHANAGYGNVVGAGTVVSGNVATFNGTTGALLGAGYTVETSITNVATALPTSSAVTTYVDGVVGDIETILDDIIG